MFVTQELVFDATGEGDGEDSHDDHNTELRFVKALTLAPILFLRPLTPELFKPPRPLTLQSLQCQTWVPCLIYFQVCVHV